MSRQTDDIGKKLPKYSWNTVSLVIMHATIFLKYKYTYGFCTFNRFNLENGRIIIIMRGGLPILCIMYVWVEGRGGGRGGRLFP